MKKILLLICFSCICTLTSKAQQLVFTYDAAGNQTERKWICINCIPAFANAKNTDQTINQINKDAKTDELKITGKNRTVKAYPNPLTEILNVEWVTNEKDLFVKTVEVYNIIGNNTFRKNFRLGHNDTQINFSALPSGSYLLSVIYSDNKRETIKIIKQ